MFASKTNTKRKGRLGQLGKKNLKVFSKITGANMNMIALFHLVEEKIVHLLFIILLRIQAKTSCSLL